MSFILLTTISCVTLVPAKKKSRKEQKKVCFDEVTAAPVLFSHRICVRHTNLISSAFYLLLSFLHAHCSVLQSWLRRVRFYATTQTLSPPISPSQLDALFVLLFEELVAGVLRMHPWLMQQEFNGLLRTQMLVTHKKLPKCF